MLFKRRTALFCFVVYGIISHCDARRNGVVGLNASGTASRALIPVSTAAPAVVVPPQEKREAVAKSDSDDGNGASSNLLVAGFNFVKDYIQSTISSCGEMYSDHKHCNTIRAKQNAYKRGLKAEWEQLGIADKEVRKRLREVKGGITYDDFRHLRRGREDRQKLMSFLVSSTFAPKLTPYLLWFASDMFLPSPFLKAKNKNLHLFGETRLEASQRQRSYSIFRLLMNLEQAARSKPSFFDFGGKQQKQTKKLVELTEMGLQSQMSSSTLLNALESRIYMSEKDRREISLSTLPINLIRGLSEMISKKPVMSFFPGFFLRSSVLGHLRNLQEEDDFLVHTSVALEDLSQTSLVDACEARMIGVVGRQRQEMEIKLAEWLDKTCAEPRKRVQQSSSELVYNGNLARTALLCYNALETVQDRRAICLPKLLVQKIEVDETEEIDA